MFPVVHALNCYLLSHSYLYNPFKIFNTCSNILMPLYKPHFNASPLPLYTLASQRLLQSSEILPSLTTALHTSVIYSEPASPTLSTFLNQPQKDKELCYFTSLQQLPLLRQLVPSHQVHSLYPQPTDCTCPKQTLHLTACYNMSKTFFYSTRTLPSTPFTQPLPTTYPFCLTSCLATLNTFPFLSSPSSFSPNFFLSASRFTEPLAAC